MLRIRTSKAEPGMTLAVAVQNPKKPGTVILREGAKLTGPTIARLAELGQDQLWVRYAPLDELYEAVNTEADRVRAEAAELMADTAAAISRGDKRPIAPGRFLAVAKSMCEAVRAGGGTVGYCLHDLLGAGDPLLRHSLAMTYLSTLLAQRLQGYIIRERPHVPSMYAKDPQGLVVASMLADLGLGKIEQEAHDAWISRHEDASPGFRVHVRESYELVRGEFEPSTTSAVLNHHQRFDGTGYPPRRGGSGERVSLRGRNIHVFARILSAADLFTRVRIGPGVRPAVKPNIVALRELIDGALCAAVDPAVVPALVASVPAYTPGWIVRLNDGRHAIVRDFRPEHPCRPTVEVVTAIDVEAKEPGEIVDLASERELTVAAVDGVQTMHLNFNAEDISVANDMFDPGQNRAAPGGDLAQAAGEAGADLRRLFDNVREAG